MDKKQAQSIIKETFEKPFDKAKFTGFVKNLLNTIKEDTFTYRGNYIPDAYEQYINTLERIGKYSVGEHKIDILIAKLKKETSIERARTMQRNFIAWYLNGSRGGELKDAALVAFVAPNEEDWRFSLVKMDYRFEEGKNGSMRVKEEFTPARRWSFLVGSNENSHTAQSQLVDILADDENNPALPQLEDAFNIERVTKEFFEKYRELFLWTEETLVDVVKKDRKIRSDFEDKGVNTIDFAKKLLGQIVFLYFLQKKGWFGVKRDEDWGTGPKNFLRELFEGKHGTYKNFFNDILESLFYEALARERDDDFYSRFNCKIPFLNGGLFDPLNNYDWVHTDIILPNELFSNTRKTKEGDKGNGILDIFDRYNFTVKEDEPLEKEVAVDPEMLGKVFENLLEVKDRKSKGTYYTPREIVHYMCQQSLINYLSAQLEGKVPRGDIETLIHHGESVSENEARVISAGKETQTYYHKIPESIRVNAKLIDDKLADIKVCDPAIGSGAFPVGMMSEIVRARNTLSNYIKDNTRTIYNFKRDCIHNSLYGVDIDSGAVEVAKLRLWLSLVVDEDDMKQIKPLPNLDYKIMQGNSLLEEYEGIKLFDEKIIASVDLDKGKRIEDLKTKQAKFSAEYIDLHQSNKLSDAKRFEIDEQLKRIAGELKKLNKVEGSKEEGLDLFNRYSEAKQQAGILKQLHKEYFETTQKKKKEDLRSQIQRIEWRLIETTLCEQGKISELKRLHEFKNSNIRPYFLWKLNFSEVFEENGGFDVVIANPPYLKERDNKKVFEIVNNSSFGKVYHQGKMDYWFYFLHKAIDMVKNKGSIAYITSRYWLNSSGASKLIERVKDSLSFISLVDIGKLKVFDNVAGQHMVAVYQKNNSKNEFVYKKLENDISDIDKNNNTENIKIQLLSNNNIFHGNEIIFEQDNFRLEGVIKLGEITDISQGVVQNPDKVSKKAAAKFKLTQGEGVFVLNKKEYGLLSRLSKEEKRFIRSFYDEREIGKYCFNRDNKSYLIYLTRSNCKNIQEYACFKEHLIKYKKIMDQRRETKKGTIKWFQLHWPREERYFENPKIAIPSMFKEATATLISEPAYFGLSTNLIISRDDKYNLKYILAIINSRFALSWFYKHGKNRGAGIDIGVDKLRSFPIKIAIGDEQKQFIELVDKIMSITKENDYYANEKKQGRVKKYEYEIDQMVYKLYNLSPDEINIVDKEVGGK